MAGRRTPDTIESSLWHRSDMRSALAVRDIATVFKLLQRVGVSQRRIAALTGQSQSEISEILGGRQVVSYEVLARIADGLGVPRGHLGLAYDEVTAELVGARPATADEVVPPMAQLTALALGASEIDPHTWTRPFHLNWGRGPDRAGLADVTRLEAVTAHLRATDYAHGGGATRDAVLA